MSLSSERPDEHTPLYTRSYASGRLQFY